MIEAPDEDAPPAAAVGVGELPLGRRFRDRYEIARELGRGGMGIVYEAFDHARGARVALKTLHRVDAVALYRLRGEFRALAGVSHPNLVSLHELGAEDDKPYFTMEYVEGVDFLEHVSDHPARLRASLLQLIEGVDALHASARLHRDVKPSNVLVSAAGRLVVLDFGLVASIAGETLESFDHDVVGTPEYMSPEQASGAPLTEASDWYSVGAMLYEALTGETPFTGPPLKILLDKQQADPRRPRELASGVPEDLDALCVELLQRDPAKRPTANALRARLGAAPSLQRAPRLGPLTLPAKSAPFVGRQRHLEQLAACFASACAGRTVVAHVCGDSGMGKTLLVRRWVDTLVEQGAAVVLAGRCRQGESLTYNALAGVVDALARHLRGLRGEEVSPLLPPEIHALTTLFPVLARIEAVNAAPRPAHESPDPQELRRRAATTLRELFARLAAGRPLVLVVDDLQWGDVDSAALLEELVRPPDSPPFLLVAIYRARDTTSPATRALRDAHARDGRDVEVHEIEVAPLDETDARGLALALLGDDDSQAEERAALVAAASGGEPLFIEELVRRAATGAPLAHPTPTFAEAFGARVAALPEDARRLLQTIAVATTPIPRRVAASAAELEGEREVAALTLLRVGRFVHSRRSSHEYEVEIYHDRVREALVAELDASARAALHRRVARALVASGGADADAVLVHFRDGAEVQTAAALAATAAERAGAALAFDRAASLWRQALELPEIPAERRRVLRWKLGDALANAGRGAEAARAYLDAVEGGSARDGLELRRMAAEQLLRCGRIGEGVEAIREALAAVGMTLPTSPLLTLLTLLFHEMLLRLRGVRFRQRDASELSAKELTRVDVLWSAGAALAIVRPILARLFQTKHLLLALRAGEPSRVARGLAIQAATAAVGGVPARPRTEALLHAARGLADRLGDPYSSALVVVADGISAHLEGRFRHAAERCEAGTQEFRDRCGRASWETSNATLLGSQALFQIGEIAELARRISAQMQSAREAGDLYLATNLRLSWMNAVWLAADDVERAEREIDEAMAQWGSPDQHLQQYYELLARAHIALYRGRGREVLALIEQRRHAFARAHLMRIQLVRVGLLHHRARGAVAAMAASDVDARTAATLAAAAMRDARRMLREGLPWATPLARLIEGAVHARHGEPERAAAMLEGAAKDLDAADMRIWSAAATRRRGELTGGDAGRALIAVADARMSAQGVKDPARYSAMLAPGYGGRA